MKKIFILFIITTIFSCNVLKNNRRNAEYFEGVITYSIDYSPLLDTFSVELLKKRIDSKKKNIGSKMILKFSKGNFLKQFYTPNGKIIYETYLDLKEKRSYQKFFDTDTIYWFDITKPDTKTTFKKIEDKLILGHSTLGIATNAVVSGVGFGEKTFKLTGERYFAKDLKINPDWYSGYKESNFNEMYKMTKGIQLLYISRNESWEKSIIATSIEKKEIKTNDIRIKLKHDSPLREL